MQIKFISNDGDGTPVLLDVAPGTTVAGVLDMKMPGRQPGYVSLNRQKLDPNAYSSTVLQPGQTLAVTPANQKGATLR